MPAPTILIITESCPICDCGRHQPFANSRRQTLCLSCGVEFDAEPAPTFNVFDALLGQANSLPEVELGAVRDLVFNHRGW